MGADSGFSCSSCGGAGSVHEWIAGDLERDKESDCFLAAKGRSDEVGAGAERLVLAGCLANETSPRCRAALTDLIVAAERRAPSDADTETLLADVIRRDLESDDDVLLEASLGALMYFADVRARDDIVAVLESRFEDAWIAETALGALVAMADDGDPRIDGLLRKMIDLATDASYEATFVLVAMIESDRPSVLSAMEVAAQSPHKATRDFGRIGLAKRGRAEFVTEVADALKAPLKNIYLDVFEAAEALATQELCEQLDSIVRSIGAGEVSTPFVSMFDIKRARDSCCGASPFRLRADRAPSTP